MPNYAPVVAVSLAVGALSVYIPVRASLSNETEVTHLFQRMMAAKGQEWYAMHWLGIEIQKNPMDTWIYQEILSHLRPDVLIECGTYKGGGAFYFATVMDLLGHGRVISIDIENRNPPVHPRITYLLGSSTDPATVERVRSMLQSGERVIVSLDSEHTREHVLAEMRAYGPLVTPGSYMVVEDTALGSIVFSDEPPYGNGNGPMAAVREFLEHNHQFKPDPACEKFRFTFQPNGWLRREGD